MNDSNGATYSRLARLAATDFAPDSDLLSLFVRFGDEAAFAALVERYGPMVLGVCLRILGDAHAAEDAFQATFLALVRSASRMRTRASVAAWLYGAAVRVSLKAQGAAVRARRAADRHDKRSVADPLSEITGRELVGAIEEEIARLAEPYRAVVLLCCVEGLSQDEAARRLGWSAGSVKGRLERGRERLKGQLARRGITLSVGFASLLPTNALFAVPPKLFTETLRLAEPDCAAPVVSELAASLVAPTATRKLASIAVLVLTVGGFAVAGRMEPPRDTATPDPVQAKTTTRELTDRLGDPLPDGALLRLGTTRLRHANVLSLAFAADGKLTSFGQDYIVKVWDAGTGRLLREQKFEKEVAHRFWGGRLSPDGSRLAMQQNDQVKVFDTASGKELASIKLASAQEAMARFSPDGKVLAVADQDRSGNAGRVQLCDVAANTCRELCQIKGFASEPVFSRDGKKLALAEGSAGVGVWDIATGRELLRFKPEGLLARTVDFDPTGDVLAVLGAINPPQAFHYVRVSTGKSPEGWTAPTVINFEWVRFAPDGSSILLGGREGMVWSNPKTGKQHYDADGWAATSPAFSPDGKLVASARRNAIVLSEMSSGRSATPKELGGTPEEEIHGVAVSPDGKWFLTKGSETGAIQVWSSDGLPKGTIKSNRWGGRYPHFSLDGRALFGVAPDAIALVRWDFPAGKETAALRVR